MNYGGKYIRLVLLGAAILTSAACTTTTQRAGRSQAALHQHGICAGDTVLVRYTNINDANSSSRSELLQITSISDSGIAGVDESGEAILAIYDEIFQIERRRTSLRRPGRSELSPHLVEAITKTGRLLGAAAYAYVSAMGGG